MIRFFRRRPPSVPSFGDLAAELAQARAELARQRQQEAWETYWPNILTVAFVR